MFYPTQGLCIVNFKFLYENIDVQVTFFMIYKVFFTQCFIFIKKMK